MSDQAFLWETEALRASRRDPQADPPVGDWVTLRQANDATGISVTTLRRWARKNQIPSYLEPIRGGELRMVSLAAVRRRAAGLDREDSRQATQPTPVTETTVSNEGADSQPISQVSSPVADEKDPAGPEVAPPGTMLVPVDAWDKMLVQLGNLHQAGQELAEARERAAKAETEVRFLRERLADLRSHGVTPDRFKPEIPESEIGRDPERGSHQSEEPDQKSPSLTWLMWRAWWARPKE